MTITVHNTQSVLLDENERKAIVHFMEVVGGDSSEFVSKEETRKTTIPDEVKNLLSSILSAIERGETISISTLPKEITTTTAASMLNVSRPTVMKYIRNGQLSARKVGSHHRLNTREVLDLQEKMKQKEREAIFSLIDFEESLK